VLHSFFKKHPFPLSHRDFSIPFHQLSNEIRVSKIMYTTVNSENQEEKLKNIFAADEHRLAQTKKSPRNRQIDDKAKTPNLAPLIMPRTARK
jgi:hypothetical protein